MALRSEGVRVRQQSGGGLINTLPDHQAIWFAWLGFVVDQKSEVNSGSNGTERR